MFFNNQNLSFLKLTYDIVNEHHYNVPPEIIYRKMATYTNIRNLRAKDKYKIIAGS